MQTVIYLEILRSLRGSDKSVKKMLSKHRFDGQDSTEINAILKSRLDEVIDCLCIQFSCIADFTTTDTSALRFFTSTKFYEPESVFLDEIVNSSRYTAMIKAICNDLNQKFTTQFFSPAKTAPPPQRKLTRAPSQLEETAVRSGLMRSSSCMSQMSDVISKRAVVLIQAAPKPAAALRSVLTRSATKKRRFQSPRKPIQNHTSNFYGGNQDKKTTLPVRKAPKASTPAKMSTPKRKRMLPIVSANKSPASNLQPRMLFSTPRPLQTTASMSPFVQETPAPAASFGDDLLVPDTPLPTTKKRRVLA
jgi:hypothetical protein